MNTTRAVVTNCAASWIVWHLRELAGVLVPAGFAVVVSPWAWLVSGVVAGGWLARAVWLAREQTAIKAGRDLPAGNAADAPSAGSDMDTSGTVDDSPVDQTPAHDAGTEVRL